MTGERAAREALDRASRLSRWGKAAEALPWFEIAADGLADGKDRAAAFSGLAMAALATGDDALAQTSAYRALTLAGPSSGLHNLLALVALHRGDGVTARKHCLSALTFAPASIRSLSMLAHCGDAATVARLTDPRHVRLDRLRCPPDFASLAAFNASLTEALIDHPDLDPTPMGGPQVGGARLHDIASLPSRLADRLEAGFLTAAEDYCRHLGLIWPKAPEMVGWANLFDRYALERSHIHENGWLSGVYYVAMPSDAQGGELVIGGHDFGAIWPQGQFRTITLVELTVARDEFGGEIGSDRRDATFARGVFAGLIWEQRVRALRNHEGTLMLCFGIMIMFEFIVQDAKNATE